MGLLNALPMAVAISGIVAIGTMIIMMFLCCRKDNSNLSDVLSDVNYGIMMTAFVVLIAAALIKMGATAQNRVHENTPHVHDTQMQSPHEHE